MHFKIGQKLPGDFQKKQYPLQYPLLQTKIFPKNYLTSMANPEHLE